MPPENQDFVFEDWYQAIGYSSNFVLNPLTTCSLCRDEQESWETFTECECHHKSVNDRDESDYLNWIVCVLALYKNPGPTDRAKFILHLWHGDIMTTSTLRSEVDAIVDPIKYSHGMYPTPPHQTIILEESGVEYSDFEILSRISHDFQITPGSYQGLQTSVDKYIKRCVALLQHHSMSSSSNTVPVCPHSSKKIKKRGLRKN